ncbi:MAG: hypothetical protein GX036_08290 [Firmicutes bacterium]|nr:hypothetical protein [Bacillota bacterium]
MQGIILVKSINYFSKELQEKGPIPLFQRLIDLGAEFIEFGEPAQHIDPVKVHEEKPQRVNYKFQYQGFEYALAFYVEPGNLYLYGDVNFEEEEKNKLSAATLFSLVETIMPMFSFAFGFFDMAGYSRLSEEAIASAQISTVFWANFFGKSYIERYGKEFLLGAPGWKKEELSDGTIEYVLTGDLFTFPDPSLEEEIKEYFAPKAEIKRFKPGLNLEVRIMS